MMLSSVVVLRPCQLCCSTTYCDAITIDRLVLLLHHVSPRRSSLSIQHWLILGQFTGPAHKLTRQPAKPHSGSVQDEVYKLRRETLIQLDASPLTRSRYPSHLGSSRGKRKWCVNPRHVTAPNCSMTVGVRANPPTSPIPLRSHLDSPRHVSPTPGQEPTCVSNMGVRS